jgi:hypothetical protein
VAKEETGAEIALGLVLSVAGAIVRGWVLKVMWGWFLTPAFGVSAPGIAVCLGISLVLTMLVGTDSLAARGTKQDSRGVLALGLATIFVPLFMLLFGFVIHQFV